MNNLKSKYLLVFLFSIALIIANAVILRSSYSNSVTQNNSALCGLSNHKTVDRIMQLTEDCGDISLLVGNSTVTEAGCKSADQNVATCVDGIITAVAPGTTRITSISDDGYRFWTLTVSDYRSEIAPMGIDLQLNADTVCEQWSSSDTAIATVNNAGMLTPVAVGECTVTASDAEGQQYGWKINVKRTAYITIDDWPNNNTPIILDILKKYDIKATFFLVGQRIHHDLYQRIIDEGHAIGNHTRTHNLKDVYQSSASLVRSVELMDEWLAEKFNVTPTKLFRFPGGYYGRNNSQLGAYLELTKRGYKIFDWTCFVDDINHSDPDVIMNLFKKTLNDDVEIILMHNSQTVASLLEDVINHLHANDYVCLPLDENSPTYDFVNGWSN